MRVPAVLAPTIFAPTILAMTILAMTILALLCGFGAATAARAEARIALVIGNSHYGSDLGTLPNPANDAKLMSATLKDLGFQVRTVIDGDQRMMKRAISDFGGDLTAAGQDAVGLFFYAGHGVQIAGNNYLVPVKADIRREADAEIEAVDADWVLKQMQFAGNQVNIVILDACRNNPLSRSTRSAEVGLAKMDAPTGSFIAYSTAPGDVAADGSGKNSPYTTALAAAMRQPGMALEETFRSVRVRVMADTGKHQVPWESSSLTGAFYFVPATASKAAVGSSDAAEVAFFNSIKDSDDPAEFQAYLDQYPNGSFARLARTKLAKLEGASASRATVTPPAPSTTKAAAAPAPTPAPAPAPTPAPVAAAPTQQAAVVPPAPIPSPAAPAPSPPADGSLVLGTNVAAQLQAYLKELRNRNGAFAVSEDGVVSGSFVCEQIGQCVGLPPQAPENKDQNYPRKRALRQCASRGHGACVVLMIRNNAKLPYSLAAE